MGGSQAEADQPFSGIPIDDARTLVAVWEGLRDFLSIFEIRILFRWS